MVVKSQEVVVLREHPTGSFFVVVRVHEGGALEVISAHLGSRDAERAANMLRRELEAEA